MQTLNSLGKSKYTIFACITLIIIAITIVYSPVLNFEFINFDDNVYVTDNLQVKKGLTKDNIIWAFQFHESTYWHPLTWFSHMADCQLFDLNAGMHHLSNLIIHSINFLLLALFLTVATGAFWRSIFVASLFALHPINVDSVAWIAERKNLLSTTFWLLTLLFYVYFSRNRKISFYLLALVSFSLGLLAKPMLATIPFIMILLDFWPLQRFQPGCNKWTYLKNYWLILEKTPFLIISILSILISMISLKKQEMNIVFESVPITLRIANGIVSYAKYILKMLYPVDLAIFYPYPTQMLPCWQIIASLVVLIILTLFSLHLSKTKPYLTFGWLWYLISLAPVSGIVQGGLWPSMADRWAYVPFIGLFICVSWIIADVLNKFHVWKSIQLFLYIFLIVIISTVTSHQLAHWKNSETVFKHALAATKDNYVAYNNLAIVYHENGDIKKALEGFQKAIEISPAFANAHYNLATVLLHLNDDENAIKHFQRALDAKPDYDEAHANLGLALQKKGMMYDAKKHYIEALKWNSNNIEARNNLALLLESEGKPGEAIKHLQIITEIDSNSVKAYYNLGSIYNDHGDLSKALYFYNEALFRKPDYADAHINLGIVHARLSNLDEAIHHLNEGIKLKPNSPEAYNSLASVYMSKGETLKAIKFYKMALKISPGFSDATNNLRIALNEIKRARHEKILSLEKKSEVDPGNYTTHYHLGCLYYQDGSNDESVMHFEKALKIKPDSIDSMNNLGIIFMNTGDYKKAINYFKNILEHDSSNVKAYYNIACAYSKAKVINESILFLEKAIDKGFDDWELLKSDPDMEIIRSTEYYNKLINSNLTSD